MVTPAADSCAIHCFLTRYAGFKGLTSQTAALHHMTRPLPKHTHTKHSKAVLLSGGTVDW
jgi:hypothetical protein